MTIGLLYNADNVVVGQAAVFVAPTGTPLPALSGWNVNDPFDETFFTGSGFVPVGATEQGWQLGAAKTTQKIQIEEQSTPVAETISTQSITIAGSLSEDVTATLTLAMNATAVATAATDTTPGYDTITPLDTPLTYAVAMVTTNAVESYSVTVATLSSPLSTGAPITSLPVNALTAAVTAGAITVVSGAQTQVFTTTGAVTGATSLPITSATPNFAYPADSKVDASTGGPGSLGRIVYAPKWSSLANISAAFRRAAGARQYAVQFETLCKTSEIEVINFTSPHL